MTHIGLKLVNTEMKNSLLFCLTLISLKLLVKAEFQLRNLDNNETDTVDLCSLQPERGSCNEKITRYYYNSVLKGCTSFTHTGCGGNPNNYPSREECKKNCPGKFIYSRQPLHCYDEPDKGFCKERIPSFYYDWKKNRCEKFVYSGCLGNNNRFTSIENCINECRNHEFSIKISA